MKPFDPRLVRYAHATVGFLIAAVAVGVAVTVLVVLQAGLIADVVSTVFLEGADLAAVRASILALGCVLAGRAAASWVQEVVAQRSSAAVKSDLRVAQAEHVLDLGPGWLSGRRSAELAVLSTRGVDALDSYYSRYLPQLVLALLVPPVLVVVVALADPLSAVIIAVTLPLIPLFLALIGIMTARRQREQWSSLERLAGHFLDVVGGLPTLKVFGRAKAQVRTVGEVSEANRRATMGVLRISFLSSFSLELLATLSVALVAVSIGLRLVDGGLDLRTGLFVLVLAPEAYLPLRLVGTHFHASAEGMAASRQVFEILESPVRTSAPAPPGARVAAPDVRRSTIRLEGVSVTYPGRSAPALDGLDLELRPGTVTALTGPSGAGKSTVLAVLLGFVEPTRGAVVLDDGSSTTPLTRLDPRAWRRQLAWLPQRPHLFAGTVGSNVRLGDEDAGDDDVRAALTAAGFADVDAELPGGLQAAVAEGGVGLSAGQRRRVALARAVLRDAPLLLLDEPTAALDEAAEARILAALRAVVPGRTVVLATHRSSLLALADTVVELPLLDPVGVR